MSSKIEPRIWKHTFLQGEDEERLRELRAIAELKESEIGDPDRVRLMGDPDPRDAYRAAAKDADDFADEAESRGVQVTLRALGRRKWRELVDANPPRTGKANDEKLGVNLDDFAEVLIPACIAGPTFTEGELIDFLDALSPAQFELLFNAAWALHKGLGADPKERLLSAPTPN